MTTHSNLRGQTAPRPASCVAAETGSETAPETMRHPLQFGHADFVIAGDAALYWPKYAALIIADLHLEKGSSYAMTGQMLPPYDSHATLSALAALIRACGAAHVICLGDNFHDSGGEARLCGAAAALLSDLTARHRWTWIIGNHDPALGALWGGETQPEMALDGIMLRHQALPDWPGAEISGHYHPKMRVTSGRRSVTRRCFTVSQRKIIMPAFGAFTGGMDAAEAAHIAQPDLSARARAHALIALPQKLARFALDR